MGILPRKSFGEFYDDFLALLCAKNVCGEGEGGGGGGEG